MNKRATTTNSDICRLDTLHLSHNFSLVCWNRYRGRLGVTVLKEWLLPDTADRSVTRLPTADLGFGQITHVALDHLHVLHLVSSKHILGR